MSAQPGSLCLSDSYQFPQGKAGIPPPRKSKGLEQRGIGTRRPEESATQEESLLQLRKPRKAWKLETMRKEKSLPSAVCQPELQFSIATCVLQDKFLSLCLSFLLCKTRIMNNLIWGLNDSTPFMHKGIITVLSICQVFR